MKKKELKKTPVKVKKLVVEEEEEVKKSRGKPRASVCHKCGIILSRNSGDNPPLCACGAQMVKARLPQSIIDKGKLSIDEIKTAESHPVHPDRSSRKMALLEEASPQIRLTNYKQFIANSKSFTDLSKWWELVFPKEDYPEDKSWFLISLRLEYKLVKDANVQDGRALTSRQLVNYVGVMEMDVKKLTPLLQDLIKEYDGAKKSKLDKEEARIIKESKV